MFTLPSELTIAKAENFREAVLEYVNTHDTIVFDDSEVTKVDTIGAQLLLSVVIFISTQNKPLQWQHHAEVIKETINKLGINDPILTQYLNSQH